MNAINSKKTGKRKKWPIVLGVAAAIIIVGLIVVTSMRPPINTGSAYKQEAVQKSSIVSTVVGSGTLEYGDTADIKMPTDIKIDEIFVEKDDYVNAGQVLASVDMTSVEARLAAVQEQIDEIDEELNSTKDDTQADIIKSHVSGRIKIIDAAEGEDAADIMIDAGSLMTVSLDGKMAVDFEPAASLSYGDNVKVLLPDESIKEGTVVQNNNGGCTVTLTDNGPSPGETAKIQDADGALLGEGTLYINSPVTIVGAGGMIETIHVGENDSISKGSKLITLSGVSASAKHLELKSERMELMETYAALVALSKSGVIVSEMSGTIEAINIAEGTKVSAAVQTASSDTSAASDAANAAQSQYGSMLTSSAPMEETGFVSMQLLSSSPDDTETAAQAGQMASITEITDLTGFALMPPITGMAPQTAISSPAYTGTVQWLPADATFQHETAYTAAISLTANAGYKFQTSIVPAVEGATLTNIVVSPDAEANRLTFNATYAKTPADPAAAMKQQPQQGTDYSQYQAQAGSAGVAGSAISGSYSGGTGAYPSSSSTGQSAATADASGTETVAFSIATDQEMVLAINIDELDILSINEGMNASIVFDAMENETYEGAIRSVADSANSSSGAAKYTAKIYMPKDEKMRAGMNATATIVIEELANVLTIPVDALQERGESVFVYTSLDTETGLPRGETEVKTGLSDGEFVEIIGGLLEGDTVYYILNTGDDAGMMMFGGAPPDMAGGIPFGG